MRRCLQPRLQPRWGSGEASVQPDHPHQSAPQGAEGKDGSGAPPQSRWGLRIQAPSLASDFCFLSGKTSYENTPDQGLPKEGHPHYPNNCQGPPSASGHASSLEGGSSNFSSLCLIPSYGQGRPGARGLFKQRGVRQCGGPRSCPSRGTGEAKFIQLTQGQCSRGPWGTCDPLLSPVIPGKACGERCHRENCLYTHQRALRPRDCRSTPWEGRAHSGPSQSQS